MRRCPTLQELESLLNEQLAEDALDSVSTHVAVCDDCQATLERLTRDSDPRPTPAPALVPAATQPLFLSRLKQLDPRSHHAGSGPAPTADEASRQVPGYEILEELGRGGMGVVYKARQVSLNRLVALKMILAGLHAAPRDLTRFQQEVEAIACLCHPNIVQIYDVGQAGSHPYCALELVEAGSLARRLRGDPQPLLPAARLVETLARAIHFAHQAGIVHRDLKPANILLQQEASGTKPHKRERGSERDAVFLGSPDAFLPKITDFGLAKRLDEHSLRTQTGEVLGTPSYMAPEQAEGAAALIGPATDVYALGAILYELLTGRPPFKGPSSLDTVLQVVHQEPVRHSFLRPGLPRDLETVCLKCLEKEPHRRYRSALDLAEDLRRFQQGEPVLARPASVWERGWKWARQRPAVAGLVAGIVLVTMLGFAGVTWQWRVAKRERDEKYAQYRQVVDARRKEADQRNRARNALYFSRIAQSQLQYRVNDYTSAVQTLERCRPQPDQIDRRGWEWYYLRGLFHADLMTWPHEQPGPGGCAAYSPDGLSIASVIGGHLADSPEKPGELQVWDTMTGTRVLACPVPGTVHRLVFTPDSRRLVLGTTDGQVLLRDAGTGTKIWDRSPHTQLIGGLAFTPDGKLVSASWDGTVQFTSLETGKSVHVLRGHGREMAGDLVLPHPTRVQSVAVHPRGHLIASGGWDAAVQLWDAATGRTVRTLRGHQAAVFSVSFSPDGRYLVSAGNNGNLKVWEVATGRPIQSLTGHTGAVLGVVFSPDSRYLAYGGSDGTVRIWDVESGVERVVFRGHTAPVESVGFSPGGLRLVTSSPVQGVVKVWDLTRHPEYATFARTGADVEALTFTAQGEQIVALTLGGKLQRWDTSTGVLLEETTLPVLSPKGEAVSQTVLAAFAPGGQLLAARSRDDPRLVKIWNAVDGTEARALRGHSLPVCCVRFSADGQLLATAGSETKGAAARREILVWDVKTGSRRAAVGGSGRVFNLAFSPDGQQLALGGADGIVTLLDWNAQKETTRSLGERTEVTALAFSPDGRFLAAGGMDNRAVLVWTLAGADPSAQQRTHRLPAPPLLCDLAFTPDSRRLAGISRDLVKLWDVAVWQEVLTLRGAPQRHWDPPFNPRVVFSPDGRRLAGTNWDESISLWEAAPEADPDTQPKPRIRASDIHALFWHLQEAEHCLEHNNPVAARFHLQRFPDLPLSSPLRERKARLSARLDALLPSKR